MFSRHPSYWTEKKNMFNLPVAVLPKAVFGYKPRHSLVMAPKVKKYDFDIHSESRYGVESWVLSLHEPWFDW